MGILTIKMQNQRGPSFFRNWHRLLGQVLFGAFYRGLIYCAIPWESSVMSYAALIVPLGTAFGTYMVSNVGRQKSPFHYSLLGAYIGEFLMGEPHYLLEESNSLFAAGVAMLFSTYGWEWRRQEKKGKKDKNPPCNNEKHSTAKTEIAQNAPLQEQEETQEPFTAERDTFAENTPPQEQEETHLSQECPTAITEKDTLQEKKETPMLRMLSTTLRKICSSCCKRSVWSCCKRMMVMLMIYGVFIGLCGSYVYFNATVETEDGEIIKVREAIDNFLNSPAWQQIKTALWVLLVDMYESWKTGGYEEAWNRFKYLADIEGEDHAYVELGLEPGTPFKDVRKRYKELAREWHPDHHHGEEEKLKAQEKFMRYNDAYQILEKIHKRRKRSDED